MGSLPLVFALLDREAAGSDAVWLAHFESLWKGVPSDGRVWLQLRAKTVSPEHRQRLFRAARACAQGEGPPVLVNGTVRDAVEAGWSGVHWPEVLRPAECGDEQLPFRCTAVHDLAGAHEALRVGAQVVTWSAVYAPSSKPVPGRGLDALASFTRACPLPVLALGGIRLDRVRPCLDAGAVGVAVLGAVSAPDGRPDEAVRTLLSAAEG